MKNFTNNFKQFTSRLSARWLLMALMMLLGTSSVWGKTYIAGSFNGWSTNNEDYALKNNTLTIILGKGNYEYKRVIDGNWENSGNRSLNINDSDYYLVTFNSDGTNVASKQFSQAAGTFYYDATNTPGVINNGTCYFMIGKNDHVSRTTLNRVAGTQYLFKGSVSKYDGALGWYVFYQNAGYTENINKWAHSGDNTSTHTYKSAFTSNKIYSGESSSSYATAEQKSPKRYEWNSSQTTYTTYQVTINSVEGGTLTVKDYDNTTISSGTYKSILTVLKFSASASTGYALEKIDIKDSNGNVLKTITDLSTTYTLTSNVSIVPTWECENTGIQLIGDESQLNLGDVEVGQSKTVQIEFEYCGISGIVPQFLNIQTGFSGSGSEDSNTRTITYNITFTPTEAGEKTATIYIPYANGGLYKQQITANGIVICTRPVIVTNSATYNQSTGLVDINYSISETGGATTHYGIQYRADGSPFPTEDLKDADFIKIGTTSNTVTNATYTYQTVLTPGTYYFRTYANNGCPDFDYSVGMVYGQEIQVVVPKKAQPTLLTLTGVETTYCTVPNEPITLSTTGGDGDGDVSYQIVNDGTTADAIIANTNKLTITSAGTLKLKAIKAADTNFNPAESAEVTVTIYADIEAGSISASATTVCQGGNVTLTLNNHTAGADVTWYADNTEVATGITEYTASNLQETTSYKVKVTRQDVSCPEKTKVTEEPIQISVDRTSAITLSGNEATECTGTSINLKEKVDSNTGTVTWYSNGACTDDVEVETPESITVNGNATYYAKAQNGVCPATEAVSYAITAKGVTIISQNPATVHPYEVTTFTASGSASWEISTNPSEGVALDNNDPVFSGKTTAYITKAAGTTTTFKGEAATGYVIKATADDCETTQTFNVEDDPNNCE